MDTYVLAIALMLVLALLIYIYNRTDFATLKLHKSGELIIHDMPVGYDANCRADISRGLNNVVLVKQACNVRLQQLTMPMLSESETGAVSPFESDRAELQAVVNRTPAKSNTIEPSRHRPDQPNPFEMGTTTRDAPRGVTVLPKNRMSDHNKKAKMDALAVPVTEHGMMAGRGRGASVILPAAMQVENH